MNEDIREEIPNYSEKHFNNPKLNFFENKDELNVSLFKSKTRLMIRVPDKLNRNGIYNIMKTFGNVTDICIPQNQRLLSGRIMAFVEYKTFSEAEKALRELNSISNTGLKIEAEFANVRNRDKKSYSQERMNSPCLQTSIDSKNQNFDECFEQVEDNKNEIPITVNFLECNNDGTYERMTNFEYKKPVLSKMQVKAHEELKKQASNSMGKYDPKKKVFIYNEELRNKVFLMFYCNVCEKQSTFKRIIDGKKRYFCTLQCFKKFQDNSINDESDTDEEEVCLKKSDKVFITAIMNEKCLYVRSIYDDLIPLFDKIYEAGDKMEMYEGIAEIGEHLLVRKFDEIFRAIIIEKSEEMDKNGWPNYIVRLTDIGNTLRVKQEDLLMYPASCLNLKISTFKITLKDVDVEAININVVDYLMSLLENKTELVIKNIDDDGVELKDNTDNTNVNQKIVSLANIENGNQIVSLRFFTQDYMPIGQNRQMFIINTYYLESLGDLICIDAYYLKDFYELYKALNAYGNKIDLKNFGLVQSEEANLVKYNNQWHRAIVTEKSGDGKPLCYFIDLQFQVNVNIENIFKLPKVLADTPIYTQVCKIKNYNPLKNQCNVCSDFLRDLLKENNFIVVDDINFIDDQYILNFTSYEDFITTHQC